MPTNQDNGVRDMPRNARKPKGFLPWVLKKLNSNVDLPTNARVFIESVVEGRRDPITGEAFSKKELDVIRGLIVASGRDEKYLGQAQPATPGVVNYQTYKKDFPGADTTFGMRTSRGVAGGPLAMTTADSRVGTTLGQFNYDLDEQGNVRVKDTYDFDTNPVSGIAKRAIGDVFLGGYGTMLDMGYQNMSAESGEGRPVEFSIPQEDFSAEDYARIVEQMSSAKNKREANIKPSLRRSPAKYEQRLYQIPYPQITNPDGSKSTHRMSAEVDKQGNWHAFPTIQQNNMGELEDMARPPLKVGSGGAAMQKALAEGNTRNFGKDKQAALNYARGGYKQGTNIESPLRQAPRKNIWSINNAR